jgi:hypothetical protein
MLLRPVTVTAEQGSPTTRIDEKVNIGEMLNKFLFEEPVKENPVFRKREQPVYRTGPAPMPSFNPAAISENPYHSEKTRGDLIKFVGELTRNVETLGLKDDDKKDLELEIKRIETQLARQSIKTRIISDSLNVINSILHEGK